MEEHIQYDFLFDNHFNELKEQEMMLQRVNVAAQMDPFLGKYFSVDYIRRQILQQTEKEMKEMDKQIKGDIDSGLAMNPADMNTFDMMDRQNDAFAPELEAQAADDATAREIEKMKALPKPSPSANKKSDK